MRLYFGKLACWLLLFGFVAGFGESVAWCQAPATPASGAKVAGVILAKRIKGKVWAIDERGNRREIQKDGENVYPKDTIFTHKGPSLAEKGSVVLVFGNGASVDLAPDTELKVDEFLNETPDKDVVVDKLDAEPTSSITKLTMARGELVGEVKKLNKAKGSSFEINTPAGAAGIRGTTFRVVFRPDPVNPGRYTFSVQTKVGSVEVAVTGAVTAPVPITDNREVVVNVEASVNPQTGQITVSAPPTVIPPAVQMSQESLQAITTATQTIVEAVQNVVIPVQTPSSSQGQTQGSSQQQDQSQGQQQQQQQQQQDQSQQQSSSSTQSGTTTTTSGGTTTTTTTTGSSATTTTTTSSGTKATATVTVTPVTTPTPPRTTSGAGGT